MNATTSEILKRLMFERQIRTTELARRIGLKQPTVHRIVEGISTRPHISSLKPLADFFAITVDQLRGVQILPWVSLQQNASGLKKNNMVPILNWEEVLDWPNSEIEPSQRMHQPIVMHKPIGENVFALVMEDSSMAPQFPKGSKLIIDPNKSPKDRSFVIVALKDHPKVIFRQLLIDGCHRYIKPLSPDLEQFQIVPLADQDKICGTLIQARLDYDE